MENREKNYRNSLISLEKRENPNIFKPTSMMIEEDTFSTSYSHPSVQNVTIDSFRVMFDRSSFSHMISV